MKMPEVRALFNCSLHFLPQLKVKKSIESDPVDMTPLICVEILHILCARLLYLKRVKFLVERIDTSISDNKGRDSWIELSVY